MIKKYLIEEDIILKDYLKKIGLYGHIQTDIKKLNGQYLVNDQTVENWYQLKKGDLLEIVLPASTKGENIKSVNKPFKIVYEDSYLLIIDKENNLACIPTRAHYENSLANYVMSYYLQKGIVANIHFVNRLDYATSGLVMLAKNPYMLTIMKETKITKQYLLEVMGCIPNKEGLIKGGIEKDPTSIIKRRLSKDYDNSLTTYQVIKNYAHKTLVLATLHTGKTHQLRLHFSSIGYPIIGDELYGTKTEDNILHLHSHYLEFIHPITKQVMKFISYPKWQDQHC